MKKILQGIGLSQNSIKIYLSILQNGSSSVSSIAKSTGINRTGIYPYLDELAQMKLIDWNRKDQEHAVSAVDPARLKKIANMEVKKAEIHLRQISNIIPNLKSMYKASGYDFYLEKFHSMSNCRFAFSQIYESKNVCGICSEIISEDLGTKWYENFFYNLFHKFKIRTRIIFPENIFSNSTFEELKSSPWFEERYARFKFNKIFSSPMVQSKFIFDDKILIYLKGEGPTCYIFKSNLYSNFERQIFESLWSSIESISLRDMSGRV